MCQQEPEKLGGDETALDKMALEAASTPFASSRVNSHDKYIVRMSFVNNTCG
jgi:hypothetical protein